MLDRFRHLYPQGSIISELIDIERGLYIVKVAVQDREVILGTGLAAADTVEKAEDKARERALMTINLQQTSGNSQPKQSRSPVPEKTPSSPTVVQAPPMVIETSNTQENYNPPLREETLSATVTNTPVSTPEPISEPQLENFVPQATYPDVEVTPEITPHATPIKDTQTNIFEQPIAVPPLEETTPVELETEKLEETVEIDFNVIKHKIDLEMKRLNWTKEQGRDYLISTYGKKSRLHLTDEELLEFWRYLETLPN